MKPIEEWTESYLLSLPLNEDYRFDRKASKAITDYAAGGGRPRIDMSCDVSAFANARGGFLIYGIDNDGKIDGGVPLDLKNGTIEWLDNVIPGLVRPKLRGHKFKNVKQENSTSAIKPDHAVIIVEITDSPDAPHQALDNRYYIRNNGKKEPAEHWVIEDIRNRITRKSHLEVIRDYAKLNEASFVASLGIRNSGLAVSGTYHWELLLPREFADGKPSVVRFDANNVPLSIPVEASPNDESTFWRFGGVSDVTVFPNRQVPFVRIAINLVKLSNMELKWRIATEHGDFPGNDEYGELVLP